MSKLPNIEDVLLHLPTETKVRVIYHDKSFDGVVVENISGLASGVWNDTDYLFISRKDIREQLA